MTDIRPGDIVRTRSGEYEVFRIGSWRGADFYRLEPTTDRHPNGQRRIATEAKRVTFVRSSNLAAVARCIDGARRYTVRGLHNTAARSMMAAHDYLTAARHEERDTDEEYRAARALYDAAAAELSTLSEEV